MPRSKTSKTSKTSNTSIFKTFFAGTLGGLSAMAAAALFSLILVSIGYSLIKQNNTPETKLFEDIQPSQYIGIAICSIGLLPWMQYLLMGGMMEAGGHAVNTLVKEL